MLTRHFPFRIGVTLLIAIGIGLSLYWTISFLPGISGSWGASRALSVLLLALLAAGAPAAAALALALTWRAADAADARVLALFLACLTVMLAGDGGWLLSQRHELPTTLDVLLMPGLPLVCMVAALAALLRFSTIFPRPLTDRDLPGSGAITRVQRRLLDPRAVWSSGAAVLCLLVLLTLVEIVGEAALGQRVVTELALKIIGSAVIVAAMSLAVLNLRAGYRHADEEGRRRIYWVVEGFFAGTAVLLVASAVKLLQLATGFTIRIESWFVFAFFAAFLVLLGCLAIAMFYAGALDPALAMRRTAVFGLVGFAMIFVFTGMEQLVQAHLGEWLGLSDRLGGILTGGTAALTFEPIKRRTDALVGRLLEQDRRNPGAEGVVV